jgi:hypothetical protein
MEFVQIGQKKVHLRWKFKKYRFLNEVKTSVTEVPTVRIQKLP